ncbi:MAG TPA: SpoIIE family protein phosphatase [Acidimicrobiales bacterium]|nr:SpoIIE family protein phosphatase [Acidimicrobiales bacterium]
MTIGAETTETATATGGSDAAPASLLSRIRASLPVGGGLPDATWRARHQGIILLLWAHAAFIPAFGMFRGYDGLHVFLESVPVPALAAIATWSSLNRSLKTFVTSVGLLTCSAILVHLSGGTIEMHFHFFVMVGVVSLYQDWIPFLAAIGYVLIHHGVAGVLDPGSVYNHYAAINGPWKWAAIHAFFIAGSSTAALVNWRLSERMVEQRDELFTAERAARGAAEVSANRLAVLADASRALFSSLEPEAVFQSVSQMVTTELADFCMIDFVEDGGQLRRVVAGDLSAEAAQLPVLAPPEQGDTRHPVTRAIRSRVSQFIAAGPDGRPPAAIVVPMIGRHDVLGTLTLGVITESATRLTEADIPFAEELARRAALAIENARLYARQRTVAETLQHSLLPERLPELPGIKCAAIYMAGGPGVEVGGDWYDVIPLSGGRLGIAIGDVVGRGERAASLMGQLRNALRAYALDGKEPGQLVNALNVLITDAGSEHMATMIYGILDPAKSHFCFANAGHPPALRLSASGEATYLEAVGGLPLGAIAGNWYEENSFYISGGDTIVLYTDGLIEERTSAIDAGLRRLKEAAEVAPRSGDLDEFCEGLSTAVLEGRPCTDDMAILAVRLEAVSDRLVLQLPSETNVLGSLRATLRRWLEAAGASDQETFELLVACGEAATNAIRHASGPGGGQFEVEAELDGDVVVTVRDHGRWRNRRGAIGGRGLPIIESYVDTLEVERGSNGTEVRMRRRLASQELEPTSA